MGAFIIRRSEDVRDLVTSGQCAIEQTVRVKVIAESVKIGPAFRYYGDICTCGEEEAGQLVARGKVRITTDEVTVASPKKKPA